MAFGSNFIPTRTVDTGNGLLFNFFMALGIVLVGFGVHLYQGTGFLYNHAILGGVLWCTGNTLAIVVIQLLGMGLSVAIWGATSMLVGWATGKFGLWGIHAESVVINWLSYCGVALGVVAIVVFAFVEPKPRRKTRSLLGRMLVGANDDDEGATNGGGGGIANHYGGADSSRHSSNTDLGDSDTRELYSAMARSPFQRPDEKPESIKDVLGPLGTRVLGVFLAIVAGLFFGVNLLPPQYLMQNYGSLSISGTMKYTDDGLDYVFSHFIGIFLTAGVYLALFRIVQRVVGEKSMPTWFADVQADKMLLPGLLCGVGWAIGQSAFLVANTNIGLVASYPIITLAPGVIATLWSTFVFREIRHAKNLSLVALGFLVVGLSCACTVIAKKGLSTS